MILLWKECNFFKDGLLSCAVLAFEAAIQIDRTGNGDVLTRNWQLLGQVHAEADNDDKAIACLMRSLDCCPTNMEALIDLGVSYTNDQERDKAMNVLHSWLASHPDYQFLIPQVDNIPGNRVTEVTNLFLVAARSRPMDPDPDVQIALGILYNISQQFERAVDCFRTALTKRPDDYLLWNKLGATLANSNHSEQAIPAYIEALKIKPTYVRARANLGISYLATKVYPEACSNFLGALELHPSSVHIWNLLRTVFFEMGRQDLVDLSTHQDIELFRQLFSF